MAFKTVLCLVVALLAHSSSGTASTYSQELCTTKFGGHSLSTVPSTTYSIFVTLPAKVKVTSTPILEITPPPVTDTITSTATTLITSTTTTATVSQTATVTVTVSTTDTITTTTTTVVIGPATTLPQATTTVPTSPGFKFPNPPSPVPPPKAKRAELEDLSSAPQAPHPRDLANRRVAAKPGQVSLCEHLPHGGHSYHPPRYPKSVVCGELVEVVSTKTITKTAPTSTITLPAVTDTITTTTTSTSIVDVAAATTVLTTKTDTTTSTILTTTTLTSTSTITPTVTPSPTSFYAACAPSNLVSPPSGYFFQSWNYNPPTFTQDPEISSAYDCCVACITNPFCKVAEFDSGDGAGPFCQLDFGQFETQCSPLTVTVGISAGATSFQTISEGNCNANIVFTYL